MQKIKLDDGYTDLTRDQVWGLFGCLSPESDAKKNGLGVAIRCFGGDGNALYEVRVTDGQKEHVYKTPFGDLQIKKWIKQED